MMYTRLMWGGGIRGRGGCGSPRLGWGLTSVVDLLVGDLETGVVLDRFCRRWAKRRGDDDISGW